MKFISFSENNLIPHLRINDRILFKGKFCNEYQTGTIIHLENDEDGTFAKIKLDIRNVVINGYIDDVFVEPLPITFSRHPIKYD